MAVGIKSVTVGTDNGGSATVTVVTSESPSATQVGDLVVVIHGNDFYNLSNMATPTATGSPTINAIANAVADGGVNLAHVKAYWYVANTAGAQTIQTTETGSHDEEKVLVAYVLSGADTTTPVDAAGNNTGAAGSANQDCPSISPSSVDAFLICHNNSGGGSASSSYTSPGSMTERYDQAFGGESLVGATEQLSASGATGVRTFVCASANPAFAAVSIAIKTAGGAATSDAPRPILIPPIVVAPWLRALTHLKLPQDMGVLTQVTAEAGSAVVGLSSSGTATHVAPRSGSSFAGVSAFGTAKKVVAQSGTCSVGGVARGTAAKKVTQVGSAVVGASETSTDKKVAVEAGRSVVGVTATGAEVKKAPQTGLATVGFDATHSGLSVRAQAGTCAVGAFGSGTVRKVVSHVGSTVVGTFTASTDKKVAVHTGLAAVGYAGRGTALHRVAQSGRIVVGATASGGASKIVSLGGRAYGLAIGLGTSGLPPEPTLMTVLYDIAVILRDFTENGLSSTVAGTPSNMRICIVPGLQAWDDCSCGALIISVPRIYGSRSFPTEGFANDQDDCGLPYIVADFTITILRCAPMPKAPDQLPSCEALDLAAQIWFDDADAVRRAIAAAAQDMINDNTILAYVLRDQTSVGPAGGCVGSEYHLFIGIVNRWGPC